MDGKAAVLADGMAARALRGHSRSILRRSISTPLNENVVMGPARGLQ